MGIANAVYNAVFRKNAVFLSTVFVGAFAFEMGWTAFSNGVWDTINRGRQWKDVKHHYIAKEEDDE